MVSLYISYCMLKEVHKYVILSLEYKLNFMQLV